MLDPTSLFTYESHVDPRTVHARTLVVTLNSFLDAGHAQRLLNDHLLNTLRNHRLGRFDADQLITYREQRPTIVFGGDHFEQYQAPELVLSHVTDQLGETFLLLTGPEPGLQWERMIGAIARLIDVHNVELTVIAQSMPMPVPHTRPIAIHSSSENPDVRDELSVERSSYEGPVGILSVIATMAEEAGIPTVSLWASVPHYVHNAPSPKATLALLDKLEELVDVVIPRGDLLDEAREWEEGIDALANDDDEMRSYIDQLERARDAVEAPEASGEAIAQEFERYLRKRDDEPGGPTAGDGPGAG